MRLMLAHKTLFDGFALVTLALALGGCADEPKRDKPDPIDGGGGSGGNAPVLPQSALYGDEQDQRATAMAVDAAGSVAFAGTFQGQIDLGAGPLQQVGQSTNMFVAVRDAAGKLLWARQYGTGTGSAEASFVARDADGNTYLLGDYWGGFDVGLGPLPDHDTQDPSVFAVKLDANGNPLWVRSYADLDFDKGSASGLAVDASSRIAIAYSVVDGCATGSGEFDGFVHMLDRDGNELWQKRWGVDTPCADYGEWTDEWIVGVGFDAEGRLAVGLAPTPKLARLAADSGAEEVIALDPASSLGSLFAAPTGELYASTFAAEQWRLMQLGSDAAPSWSIDLPAEPTAVAAGPAGVLVAGRSATSWILRLDSSGKQAWNRELIGDIEPNGTAWALDEHPILVGACRGIVDLGDGLSRQQTASTPSSPTSPPDAPPSGSAAHRDRDSEMRGAIVGAIAAVVVIGSCDGGEETAPAVTAATTGSAGAGTGGQGGGGGAEPSAICAELDLPALPFASGPFGTHRGEFADDFEVALVDGSTFRLSERWSGCETYLFVPDSLPVSQLDLTSIWDKDDLDDLVAGSPLNTHYFFVSRQTTPEAADAAAQAMQGRIDALLATLEPTAAEHWRTHLHVIAGPANALTSWVGGVIGGHGRIGFGIDRSQRIRGLGYLSDVDRFNGQLQQQMAWPWESNLAYAAHDARYFNAQHDRLTPLDRSGATVVTLWDGEILEEFAETTVALPPPEEMTGFDTLEIEVEMQCPDPDDIEPNNCGAWDYLAHLYVKDATNTDVEIARFITAYHRETHWIVDVTPMLAHLLAGGMHTFRWSFAPSWNTQPTATRLRLHLSNRNKGHAPRDLTFLFAGGVFGSTYNDAFLPVDVPIPADAQRVELWSLITGHGGETNNCAEFCNHQHELTINGQSYVKAHPEAATNDGCIAELEHGMVPNQPGTWWFGRGGWCPGQQVEPWVVDVTADITPGQTAQITYEGTYAGGPPPDASGNIVMTSYLVVYR